MRDDDNDLGPFLSLKIAGADNSHDRNNTTINHDNGGGQNAAEPAMTWEDNYDSSNNGNWQPTRQQGFDVVIKKNGIKQKSGMLREGSAPNHWPVSRRCCCKQACLGPALNRPIDSHHYLAAWHKWHNNNKTWPIILTGTCLDLISKNSTLIQLDSIWVYSSLKSRTTCKNHQCWCSCRICCKLN